MDPTYERKTLRGHTCEGLRAHHRFVYCGCIPRFGELGEIHGCDATNYVLLNFCPYCGTELAKVETHSCKKCGCYIDEYDYETIGLCMRCEDEEE